MGIFKSLFGGKKEEPKVSVKLQAEPVQYREPPVKNTSSSDQDLLLLSVAENYKVGEMKYPEYFRSKFGVGFPNEKFQKLEKEGLIRRSTAKESLPHLKGTDLKAIATQFGIKASGKKEEICTRIAESTSDEALDGVVQERYWVVTEKGQELLGENPHISFYMAKHPYQLEEAGLDINTLSKLFTGKPNGRVRDVIWGEFNRRSMEYYSKAVKSGEFRDYCNLLRTMALFLEEENRHQDALAMYMRYMNYRSNFEAVIPTIRYYSIVKKEKEGADTLFMHAEIYPFHANEIIEMSNGCGFNSDQLRAFIKETLSKENDSGPFTPDMLADLIMCGLNGDQEGQKKLCGRAMKEVVKNVSRR